jgi:hypothetical protein
MRDDPHAFVKGSWGRVALSLCACLLAACVDDKSGNPVTGSKTAHGVFRIALLEELPPFWEKSLEVSARLHDAPSPDPVDWRVHAVSGDCHVLTPSAPFCDPGCGSTGVCAPGGMCVPFPTPLNVGRVTVTGIEMGTGDKSFSLDPVQDAYQRSGALSTYPPYAEGATLTVTAAGSADVAPFTVSGRGPHIPKLLNDSIVLDGSPFLLRWAPPGPEAGSSRSVITAASRVSSNA